MKFLITGITGFIGSHLYKHLLAEGHEIVAQVRNFERADALEKEGIKVLKGDLTLFKDKQLMLPEVDVVIHLAGVIAAESLSEYEQINFQAVVDIVECLHRQSWSLRKFVFASSLAAAGPSNGKAPHTEDTHCNPVDQYGIAKFRAEQFLRDHANFPTTSFRPALVLGPGDGATLTLYKMAKSGFGFKAAGFDQRLSFLDIDDLKTAIVAMSEEKQTGHKVYFVSGPVANTTDFFNKIGRSLGRNGVTTISIPVPLLWFASKIMTFLSAILGFKNQLDDKQYRLIVSPAFVCSSGLLEKDTNWSPCVSLETSLDKAVAGYRNQGLL